jgi:predicted  nucleic acid-binding Zn-ribbon protein
LQYKPPPHKILNARLNQWRLRCRRTFRRILVQFSPIWAARERKNKQARDQCNQIWSLRNVTDITVKLDPATSQARIEIRNNKISGTRFRLRDPYTEKYLTKRGWTKTASFLPGQAVLGDDVTTLALDAELAGKIAPGTNLLIEQPNSDFEEIMTWPRSSDDPAALASEDMVDEDQHEDEDDIAAPNDADATAVVAATAAEPSADNPAEYRTDSIAEHQPPQIESVEPTIMHDHLDEAPVRDRKPEPLLLAGDDNRPSRWRPTLIAASVCLLVGLALGGLWQGAGRDAAIRETRETAAVQRQKQQTDFDRQLKQAKAAAGDAGAAQTALAARDKSIAKLKAQLADANAQIQTVRNATGDKAKAELAVLDKKIAALNDDLAQRDVALAARDKAVADMEARLAAGIDALATAQSQAKAELAERDRKIRDMTSKLSIATLQLDALKAIASKNDAPGQDNGAANDKLARLSAELDRTSQALSDREQALADANAKLKNAEAKLAARPAAEAPQAQTAATSGATDDQAVARLREERDLYADELKKMTANFSAIQAQKAELEKTVAGMKAGGKEGNLAAADNADTAATIWGATAIDPSGAVYSVQNKTTEKEARTGVANLCQTKSGSRCEALASYSSACFSLARFAGEQPSVDNFAYFVHKDAKTARRTALERCESQGMACTTRFTACSPDALSKAAAQ